MNKSELITELARRQNLTEKQAAGIIDLIFNGLTGSLMKGERIEIRGFGSLSVRIYKTYTGRNPVTGEKVAVKPKKLPFFKVGKELKKLVDSKK